MKWREMSEACRPGAFCPRAVATDDHGELMARKRASVQKRQREYEKRQREIEKARKAAAKRERRAGGIADVDGDFRPSADAERETPPVPGSRPS